MPAIFLKKKTTTNYCQYQKVGSKVGFFEGKNVGSEMDGKNVGSEIVGRFVGFMVGSSVGVRVGLKNNKLIMIRC